MAFYQYKNKPAIYKGSETTPTGETKLFDPFQTEEEFIAAGGTPYWRPDFSGESNVKLIDEKPQVIRYQPDQSPYQKYMESLYGAKNVMEGGQGGTISESAYQEYQANKNLLTEQQKEDQIRNQQLKNYQGLIDEINKGFAQEIQKAEKEGISQEGRARSLQSRMGILSTPMGEAQTAGVKENIRQNIQAINTQRESKIASIFQKIDENTQTRLETEKNEAFAKSEKYLEYLKSSQEETKIQVAGLAQMGVDIERLDPSDRKEIQTQLGMSEDQLKLYWNSKLPASAKIDWKIDYDSVSGTITTYGVNPLTGKLEYTKTETGAQGLDPSKIKEVDGEFWAYDEETNTMKKLGGGKKVEKGPTSYQEWQYAGGKERTGKSYAEWLEGGGGGGTTAMNLATTLYNVGLSQTIVTNKGKLTDSSLTKLGQKGIAPADAQTIMDAIVDGKSLEEIRTELASQLGKDVGFKMLDDFMQTLQGTSGNGISDDLFNSL